MELVPFVRKAIVTAQRKKEDEMHALAQSLGFFCLSSTQFLLDLASRIKDAMKSRGGTFVYQSAAFSADNFPLELARQVFALATTDSTTPSGTSTWRLDSSAQTAEVFGSIFEDAPACCSGCSKAFKSQSEPVIRVLATIMPGAIISHVVLPSGKVRLYVNFNYVLSDEAGELHPPKDKNRNEIELTPQEVHEIRAQVASDALAIGLAGSPLSAGWWRQVGMETEALMAEAMLQNVATAPAPAAGKRRRAANHYEIDEIVDEQRGWFLVRWAGYHASWEAWRVSGVVGSPVETWEQLRILKNTEALREWRQSG